LGGMRYAVKGEEQDCFRTWERPGYKENGSASAIDEPDGGDGYLQVAASTKFLWCKVGGALSERSWRWMVEVMAGLEMESETGVFWESRGDI
jgi:hypothetical protein